MTEQELIEFWGDGTQFGMNTLGAGVMTGVDFTLFAAKDGVVKFTEKKKKKFDGRVFKNIFVSVV